MELNLPPTIKLQEIPVGKTLNGMLDAREMDAVIIRQPPPSSFMKGSPKVARLFPNYREAEMAYYKTTGHFPTMHTIAIKRSVYDANPWPRLT